MIDFEQKLSTILEFDLDDLPEPSFVTRPNKIIKITSKSEIPPELDRIDPGMIMDVIDADSAHAFIYHNGNLHYDNLPWRFHDNLLADLREERGDEYAEEIKRGVRSADSNTQFGRVGNNVDTKNMGLPYLIKQIAAIYGNNNLDQIAKILLTRKIINRDTIMTGLGIAKRAKDIIGQSVAEPQHKNADAIAKLNQQIFELGIAIHIGRDKHGDRIDKKAAKKTLELLYQQRKFLQNGGNQEEISNLSISNQNLTVSPKAKRKPIWRGYGLPGELWRGTSESKLRLKMLH